MSKTSTVCHKRSSVITEGVPKQPTTDQIDYGEIAINYAASGETLYIKNSENAIAEFKDNKYYQKQLSEKTDKTLPLTYSELVSLRDNSQLIPGQQYRITDYVTTTSQENTRSAGNLFDIIVTAVDTNKLSELANAIQSARDVDGYFSNSNLNGWKLKYCLDNDTTRFAWADTINGKGVIFWMKDEYDNECPYDFKNIQFKRYAVTNVTSTNLTSDALNNLKNILVKNSNGGLYFATKDSYGNFVPSDTGGASYEIDENDSNWYYTFQGINSNDGSTINKMYDLTVETFKLTDECISFLENDGSGADTEDYCRENKIEQLNQEYFSDYIYYKGRQILNNIVFIGGLSYCFYNSYWEYNTSSIYGNRFGVNCNSSTFFGYYCYGNTFGNNCYGNTFGNNCNGNTFGNNCYGNTFGNNCYGNTFGNNCHGNTFGYDCYFNTFGNDCDYNTFGNDCNYNTFGTNCNYNTFGNDCDYNTFGNDCESNTFGNYCYDNTFGNYCYYNTFGNYIQESQFGDSVRSFSITTRQMATSPTSADVKDYIRWLIVENGVRYVNAYVTGSTSNLSYCQNVRICLGTQGVNSNNRKTFDITSCINSTLNNVLGDANFKTLAVGGSDVVTQADVVNSLVSTEQTKPLSANMGKVLNDKFGGYIPKTGGTSGTIEIYSNTQDRTIIGNPDNTAYIDIREDMHQPDDNWHINTDGGAGFKTLNVSGSEVITVSDIVNSIQSTDQAKPLSANMGKVLSDRLNSGDLIPKEAKMQWGGQNNNEGNLSPIESLLTDSANRLTFGNAEGVTVEYSTDGGSTWNAYTERTDYEKLLYPVADAFFCLGGSDSTDRETTLDDMLRITINAKGVGRYLGGIRKMLIYGGTRNARSLNVVLEARRAVGGVEGGGDNAFEQIGTLTYDGWPAWGAISLHDPYFGTWNRTTTYNGGSVIEYRLTFSVNDISYTTYGAPYIQLIKLHSLIVYEAEEFVSKYGSPLQLMNDGYIHTDRELYLTKRVQAQNMQVRNLNVLSSLNITPSTTIQGVLTVGSKISAGGNIEGSAKLTVEGDATLKSNATVSGDLTVNGTLNYTRARMETSEASVTLDASKYIVINCGSELTINLPNGYATDGKEYVCELHTGSVAPTISFPSDIKFAFGENFVNGFEPNYVYQISIQNSLAVVIPFV